MNIIKTLTPTALAIALSLAALPAAAQQHGRDERGRAARETRDVGRGAPRESAGRAVARQVAPRQIAPRQIAPRQYVAPRYEPRRDRAPVYAAPRYGARYAAPRGYRPYYRSVVPYRPHFFERPYYAFRPRLNIGFGLWLGFGVPYPRAWVSTYPPPVYGYYQGEVQVVPDASVYGGISFDISPVDAAVYLDGECIGNTGDFAPNAAPLTVTPGRHHIEVQADGYQPATWDVTIVAGEVIPFRGAMQPY